MDLPSDFDDSARNKQLGQDLLSDPNSSIAPSQESSLTAQGLITYNKTIIVRPEELVFS